jgi:hypothetical protein
MNNPKSSATGADWTQLLADPELVNHLGKLLQIYRDAPPEKRDEALLDAMREIKGGRAIVVAKDTTAPPVPAPTAQPVTTKPADSPPPFEPDIFTPSWGQDRRRYPRMKCFVAVELREEPSGTVIWGNLADTSLGGCFVETATAVPSGSSLQIGLWLANGKIWIKGVVLKGIVTKSSLRFGVRIKFDQLEPTERETLRHFLKFVESTTKGYYSEHGYLAKLER